jgi:hypothetical protein
MTGNSINNIQPEGQTLNGLLPGVGETVIGSALGSNVGRTVSRGMGAVLVWSVVIVATGVAGSLPVTDTKLSEIRA